MSTKNITFTPRSLIISGKTYPALYSRDEKGVIYAHVSVKDGDTPANLRIAIAPDESIYPAALTAAQGKQQAAESPAEKTASKKAAPPEKTYAKKSKAAIPYKSFVGTTLEGAGWRIVFDGEKERTRVILGNTATPAMQEAVKAAGFYWSGVMQSYNKKLTHKAHRAAQALAKKLAAMQA